MQDIFGFLTVNQWLALLRIAVGLWWIKSVFHKPLRKFVSGQMVDWTLALADNHPVPAYGAVIRRMVVPSKSWFPYLILLGEAAAGIGLILGFLTPVAALLGVFLNLNYLGLAGVRPKDISVNRAYQCEQGQNLMMVAAQVVLFVMASGRTWGLDGILGIL